MIRQLAGTRVTSRTPTATLLLGLVVTLATVLVYSAYISRQISGLRQLQTDLTDRNRRDSLQLLRIQGDLNQLALAMRDMLDPDETYPDQRLVLAVRSHPRRSRRSASAAGGRGGRAPHARTVAIPCECRGPVLGRIRADL